ncbi:hypothetical protein N9731_00205 [Gammaproteobacteria bacterium]|jgi:hypothetical protein|nr:hypothetical protein [Gammaproteobacteria bacterium]
MSKRIFYPLLLLLLPLIGSALSDDVNWSLFDFFLMGGMLLLMSTSIHLIISKEISSKKKALLVGISVLIFLLIWAELAVGIFGTPFAGR